MKVLAVTAIFCAAAVAQTTSRENQVRDRGQTPTQDPRETLDRGRIGTQQSMPKGLLTFTGILVDAGCKDRTMMSAAPPPQPGEKPQQRAARSKRGPASGAAKNAQNADAMEHQVPDLASRQDDPSCSVTGDTRGFALLTRDGRLLNLDEGGNTKAMQAFQSSPSGQDVLNGRSKGDKPKATITGKVRGDKLIVRSIRL